MNKGRVTGYADEVDLGSIKDVETGQVFSFKKSDIVGPTVPHRLVGTIVPFQSIEDHGVKIFPSSETDILNEERGSTSTEIRFRGYFTLNDAFAGFFSNLIWGLHALVIITLIWVLFNKEFLGSLGANDFLDRFWIVLGLLVIYTTLVGILTTFISINEHLREINKRL